MKVTRAGYWPDGSQPARFDQDNVPDDEPKPVMPKSDIKIRVKDDMGILSDINKMFKNQFWI